MRARVGDGTSVQSPTHLPGQAVLGKGLPNLKLAHYRKQDKGLWGQSLELRAHILKTGARDSSAWQGMQKGKTEVAGDGPEIPSEPDKPFSSVSNVRLTSQRDLGEAGATWCGLFTGVGTGIPFPFDHWNLPDEDVT